LLRILYLYYPAGLKKIVDFRKRNNQGQIVIAASQQGNKKSAWMFQADFA